MANPKGTESPYEYVEIVSTKDIDFSKTPYTLLFCNNGTILKPLGWMTGSTLTYAIELNSGIVHRGEVFYVGGDSTKLSGVGSEDISNLNWLKTVDYLNEVGDGNIGLNRVKNIGLIGNGGPSADGIAIFPCAANQISETSLPSDCVFYGDKVGETASFNYLLPDGTYFSESSFFYKKSAKEGRILKFSGVYDYVEHAWVSDRVMKEVPLKSSSDLFSEIKLVPSVYDLQFHPSCSPSLSWKSANNRTQFAVFSSGKSAEDIIAYVKDSLEGKSIGSYDCTSYGLVHSLDFSSQELWDDPYWAVFDIAESGLIDTSLFTIHYNTIYKEEERQEPTFLDSVQFIFDSEHTTLLASDFTETSMLWSVDAVSSDFDCSDLYKWVQRTVTLMDTCGNRKDFDLNVFVTASEPFYFMECPLDTVVYLSSGKLNVSVEDWLPAYSVGCDSSYLDFVITPNSMLDVGIHQVSYLMEYNGVAQDSCSFLVDVRIPDRPTIKCPSDTIVWRTEGDYISVALQEPISSENSKVQFLNLIGDELMLHVPDSVQLYFYAVDDYGYHSDTCSYWIFAKDSITAPSIICPSDTIIPISLLASGYMPMEAISPEGKVESLFRQDEVLSLQEGERKELRFVAHDTIDGTHHSDTCSYWLTVMADTIEYYTPEINCLSDTTIRISVLLAGYTPEKATSSDGKVESLFRQDEVLSLQ
ncbi:MAG: hypothetical protein J5554_06430, partial [Paludibacteraceae bacterium]|nr:hypothetical protein [Paludibacteraceae bacterium]